MSQNISERGNNITQANALLTFKVFINYLLKRIINVLGCIQHIGYIDGHR